MAALLVFCLPIVTTASGGGFAYTMYASSTWFRLEITAVDGRGATEAVAPSALAGRVSASAVPFLAGADHFRRTYGLEPLRDRLSDVARVACLEAPEAVSIAITLFERDGAQDAPERARTERVPCPR